MNMKCFLENNNDKCLSQCIFCCRTISSYRYNLFRKISKNFYKILWWHQQLYINRKRCKKLAWNTWHVLKGGVESWRFQIGVESWLNIWIEVYFNLQWVPLCPAVPEVAQSHVVMACAKRLSGVEWSYGVKAWSRRVEWNFGVIPRPSFNHISEYNKWLKKKYGWKL